MSETTLVAIENLTGDYTIDPTHTRLGFAVRHAMVTTVRGSFEEFTGSAHLDATDPSKSSATLTITTASITTGNAQRDGHLRTNDFFDAENFPTITFTSTSARRVSEDTYELSGDLTIKGVAKPVAISFEFTGSAKDPFGNLRAGFEGSAQIKRSDFGLSYNAVLETGGVMISDKVKLDFDVSAIKNA